MYSLNCLWTSFYETQISYIKRSQASRRFIVCEVIVRSILTRNLENVKHSSLKVSTYNIVQIVERLIIVWNVKWVYACHMNASRVIMIRKECHTNALINSEIWKRFETLESDLVISNELRMYLYFSYCMSIYHRCLSLNYTHIHVILVN